MKSYWINSNSYRTNIHKIVKMQQKKSWNKQNVNCINVNTNWTNGWILYCQLRRYLIVQFVVSIPQCFKRRLYVCIFNSKYICYVLVYVCESMRHGRSSACVAHVCGVCNNVHKYVYSLLCLLFYMLLLLSYVSIFSNCHVCYCMRCLLFHHNHM